MVVKHSNLVAVLPQENYNLIPNFFKESRGNHMFFLCCPSPWLFHFKDEESREPGQSLVFVHHITLLWIRPAILILLSSRCTELPSSPARISIVEAHWEWSSDYPYFEGTTPDWKKFSEVHCRTNSIKAQLYVYLLSNLTELRLLSIL